MSSSHQPKQPTTYIDIGMYGMSAGRPDLDSDSQGGARPSYEEMMKELACKLQGEHQSVRHFAAIVEVAVIKIHLEHPQQMDEEKMAEVKRTRFYHGLKRVYKESFVHLYEEGASFERLVDAVLVVEEALLKLETEQKEKKNEDSPCRRKLSMGSHHKKDSSWGWARTNLEPKVLVHVYERPLDAILDLGASISFIDKEIVDSLGVEVHPFICNVPQCVSFEGAKLTNSVLNVIGWIELELGILGVGLFTTRLWVVKSMFNKGVPIILGSHQIKKIFLEANVKNMDCWQQPWKFIHEYLWQEGNCSEDLSDSDHSEEESFDVISQ